MPEDLIGTADVMTILKIDRSTVSRWVASGRLTTVGRLNGGFVFSRSDIERVAEQLVSEATR